MNWYKKAQFENLEKLIKPDDRIVLSKEMNIEFRDVTGSQKKDMKPVGLWYSGGLDWMKWALSEMPHWLDGNLFKLGVNPGAMLILDTPEKVLDFSTKYKAIDDRAPTLDGLYIDWPSVAKKYAGIEIIPYQSSLRMDRRTSWYYGWDVASGCIWGSSAIEGATRLTVDVRSEPGVTEYIEERRKERESWYNPPSETEEAENELV